MNHRLLQQLCAIEGTSGDESAIQSFIINHIKSNTQHFGDVQIFEGEHLHDNCIVVKGNPVAGIFCHIDTVGFMTRYDNKLTLIGSPECENGTPLKANVEGKTLQAKLVADENAELLCLDIQTKLPPGIRFSFDAPLISQNGYVQGPYLDNRLGVYMALEILQQADNVLIAFSTYEEHGGGSIPMLLRYIMQRWPITKALVLDITWVTEGVHHGKGVVISLRDRNIPRRKFVDALIALAQSNNIPYQLEVEEGGSSDGREIQTSPYSIDWCFVGPPESGVHSIAEKVSLTDIQATIQFYLAAFTYWHQATA